MIDPLEIHKDASAPDILGWFDFGEISTLTYGTLRSDLDGIADLVAGTNICDNLETAAPKWFGSHGHFVAASEFALYSDEAAIGAHATQTSEYTLFFVARPMLSGADRNIGGWSVASGLNGAVLLRTKNNGTMLWGRNNGAWQTQSSTATFTDQEWAVFGVSVTSAGAAQDLYIDGVIETYALATGAASTPAYFEIGGIKGDGSTKYFNGDIRCALVFDGGLTTAQMREVGAWLHRYYINPPISVGRAQRTLYEFGAVQRRTGAAAALQSAYDAQSRGGGFDLIVPGGPWYLEDTVHVGSQSSTYFNNALNMRGVGTPVDFSTFPYCSGGTVLVPIYNDTAKPMFDFHGWGWHVSDLAMANSGRADYTSGLATECFVQLTRQLTIGTGKLSFERVHFESHPTYTGFPAIKTNEAGVNNQDESYFVDCSSWGVDVFLQVNNTQSIGWNFERLYAVDCSTVFEFKAGGKLVATKCHWRRDGGSPLTVLDLRGTPAQITVNTSIWAFYGCSNDGGNNTTDITLVSNTNPVSTQCNLGTIWIAGYMAQHDTQTVPYLDLENGDFTVHVDSCTLKNPGSGFFHMTGKSSSDKATLIVTGGKPGGSIVTASDLLDATSSNVDLVHSGVTPQGRNVLPAKFGFPGSAAVS